MYRYIAGVHCLFILVKVQKFFKFQYYLQSFNDMLWGIRYDMAFFILMSAGMLLTYALMGWILLGHYDINFGTYSGSVLTCFNMIVG